MALGDQFEPADVQRLKLIYDSDGELVGFQNPKSGRNFRQRVNADGDIELEDGTVRTLSEVYPEVPATASATSTPLTGAGTYSHYRCTVAAGNITVFDSTSGSGKVLVPTTALAVGVFPILGAGHPGRVPVANGVTVVLSGAATVYAGVQAD